MFYKLKSGNIINIDFIETISKTDYYTNLSVEEIKQRPYTLTMPKHNHYITEDEFNYLTNCILNKGDPVIAYIDIVQK